MEFLKDPIVNKGKFNSFWCWYLDKAFTEVEDYILSSKKNSAFYDGVVRTKGESEVKNREKFLDLDN